jgi:hypothetical protein
MTTPSDPQFTIANRAIERAADKIERAVAMLIEQTASLDHVAPDYVIEGLADTIIKRNPNALDWLNRQRGEVGMRLANAVADWRDLWGKR